MSIQKWMSSRLVTIQENEPVSHAFELMLTNDIRHLPVVTKGKKLVGIITDRDLSEAIIPANPSENTRNRYHTVRDIKAKDIMTPNPVTIDTDATIQQAAQIFLDRKIDCLPVRGPKARLVGIVTSTDIIKAFVEFTRVLEDTRRIDIAMDGTDYQKVLQVLESHGVSIVSVGITEDERIHKTVVSFRVENADVTKLAKALKKQGLTVLSGD